MLRQFEARASAVQHSMPIFTNLATRVLGFLLHVLTLFRGRVAALLVGTKALLDLFELLIRVWFVITRHFSHLPRARTPQAADA